MQQPAAPSTQPPAASVPPASAPASRGPMVETAEGETALVLESPHSGTWYPPDFGHACDLAVLRRAEDTHVDKLYRPALAKGVAWVEAKFPRSYLDVNRNTTEIDPSMFDAPWPGLLAEDPAVVSKVRLGKGLIWKCTDEGVPIYRRSLSVQEGLDRIERCWKPYHAAVGRAVDSAYARHGYVLHVDCHSMPAVAASHATDFPGLAHADFVIGDRDGTTAAPAVSALACDFLRNRGYDVGYNHPYKGMELVRRYGDPAGDRHSIQVEINRGLYMDERSLVIDEPGFARLQADLMGLVDLLLATDPRSL